MPYTTLNYANGPGVNFTSGKRPNLTNVDTSESDIFLSWTLWIWPDLSSADIKMKDNEKKIVRNEGLKENNQKLQINIFLCKPL